MTPELVTGLQEPVITPFAWVSIALPGGTVRLVDGAHELTFGGHTWRGRDAALGALAGLGSITDGPSQEEQPLAITLHGYTVAGLNSLIAARGAAVQAGLGLVNQRTGAVVGSDLAFLGEVETLEQSVDASGERLTVNAASIWVKMMMRNEGHRLNGPYHEQAWPGELGLEYTQGLRTAQTQSGVFNGITNYDGTDRQNSERALD